jgi:hypothetical protein
MHRIVATSGKLGSELAPVPMRSFDKETIMTSSTPAIERIARVLAGERLSSNAEGTEPSAGSQVDAHWHEFRAEAVAILKSLREPPPEVAQSGDCDAWTRSIGAMLGYPQEPHDEQHGLDEVAESARHFLRAPS